MGTLVTVESIEFLLQREDHAAALDALRAFVAECPDDWRSGDGKIAATDLVGALAEGDWIARTDEHGDIVGLSYGGDKVPPGASDEFPMSFFEVIAPFVRYGSFSRWMEGTDAFFQHTVSRGKNTYGERAPGVELRQRGEAPSIRPGEEARIVIDVRGVDMPEGTRVRITSSHSTQVDYGIAPNEVAVGSSTTVTISPRTGAADPACLFLATASEESFDLGVRFSVATPPEQADALHEIIATTSWLDHEHREPFVLGKDIAEALVQLKRHAARHAGRPGAEALAGVTKAADLAAAFRAVDLEAEITEAGLFGVRFIGKRLPCYERYLFGLFAAMRGLVVSDSSFGLVYAHDPKRRVVLSYEWGVPSRDVWDE